MAKEIDYDFCGWATKNDLKCSDGRTIMKGAFAHNDGQTVPLVWNHQHNSPEEVLGHALLENRDDGMYAYCSFNDSESARTAKLLVQHGDIDALSIYANQLKENMGYVKHGNIREVSLVLAGANPGAYIETVIAHSDDADEEACIFTGEQVELYHACDENKEKEEKKTMEHADKERTVGDVLDTLNEEQQLVVVAMLEEAIKQAKSEGKADGKEDEKKETKQEDEKMIKHNVFENDEKQSDAVLAHDAMNTIIGDAKRYGSMKESYLAHTAEYGIDTISNFFPDPKAESKMPDLISRDMDWVDVVMNSVHHTPFSRIKSMAANITADDARAKGYVKGNLKVEEVITSLKRSTTPTTIYKKQKLDRDDVIDITDFDVVAFIKAEMRTMLNEEIARAILIGDGRAASSDDKVNEGNIRPIMKDDAVYAVQKNVSVAANATDEAKAKAFIKAAVKARKDYKGSGNPTLYTTEDLLTDCLLIEDSTGRIIYEDESKLAKALRVSKIVTVPVMENTNGKNGNPLMGIIVNLADYSVGADKGGSAELFEDFDIDYNAMKYLIETRCSGALTKPYSALVFECVTAS